MPRRYVYETQLFDVAKDKLGKMPGWKEHKKYITPDTVISSKEMEIIFQALLEDTNLTDTFNGKKNPFYARRLYYSLYAHSHNGPISKILHVFESMFGKQLKSIYRYIHPVYIRCPAIKQIRNMKVTIR